MLATLSNFTILVARFLITALFLYSGYGKIDTFAGVQGWMESMGVPGFMLYLVVLLEIGGGLAILAGFLTRPIAIIFAVFSLLSAIIFHGDFSQAGNDLHFYKNLSITAGFMLLAVTGAGFFSLDRILKIKF